MEVRRTEILKKIFEWIPNSEGFKIKIKSILVSKDSRGKFNEEVMLNRFAYTIVDQQRDVDKVIIPLWNTLVYYGMNRDFLCNSSYASMFISSIFQAYGHQQYHTKRELKVNGRTGASRTEAFLDCYKERTPTEFLDLIMEKRENLLELFSILTIYTFISDKSAAFFLRDIEGIEFSLVPIDSNVARSLQRTGLLFTNLNISILNFDKVLQMIIPIKKRTDTTNFKVISDKIFEISNESNKSPYELNRYLFLLGADYCKINACERCNINELCYFYNLNESEKAVFRKYLKS